MYIYSICVYIVMQIPKLLPLKIPSYTDSMKALTQFLLKSASATTTRRPHRGPAWDIVTKLLARE